MSFTGLRLKNFKCFADSGDVRLAPLTLLFGRNNSGKSSVLQSLLLLRQSLDAPTYEPRLNLGGALYSAGTYSDIVHLHKLDKKVSFSLSFSLDEIEAHVDLTFMNEDPHPPRLSWLAVRAEGQMPLEIRRGAGRGGPYELWLGDANRGSEKAANFSFPVGSFLPLIGDEPPQRGRPNETRRQARHFARAALGRLEELLQGVSVIGAFRRPPERHYEFRGTSPPGADCSGRQVVDALIQSTLQKGRERDALFKAVNDWLRRIAGVEIAPLEAMDPSGKHFSLTMRDIESGRFANFADVGFGIGQALPVLVEGLRTAEGGAFIVQEPEIHLHPDAQLAMADFLVDLTRAGRQVVVETHSEHILLRVRRRMLADGKAGISREQVSVIYIGRGPSAAGKAIPLGLDSLGQAEDWPDGFLQEATEERMALLEELARKLDEGE